MAALVTPLVSGIPAASSGTVEFYVKGTATPSTKVYSNAAGTTVPGSHVLDAYGAITRYVTEPVDITVKTAGGATVKTFTFQDDARLVGLESLGFNGALTGGGTGPGGFITEHTAWAEMFESLGGLDGRVNSGSGNVDIKVAAPGAGGFFFAGNYGAGPAVIDNLPALQAMVSDAALVSGGILVLGSQAEYRMAGSLSGFQDMLVIGQGATITQTANSTNGWFSIGSRNTFVGIHFVAAGGVTAGRIIDVLSLTNESNASDAGQRPTFINCVFDAIGWLGTYVHIASGAYGARFIGCAIRLPGGTLVSFGSTSTASGTSPMVEWVNCRLRATGAIQLLAGTAGVHALNNCYVSLEAASASLASTSGTCRVQVQGGTIEAKHAGTSYLQSSASSGAMIQISGTKLVTLGGATLIMSAYQSLLYDGGCHFEGGNISVGAPHNDAAGGGYLTTRRGRIYRATAVTSLTPDIASYRAFSISQSSGATFTFNNPSPDFFNEDSDFVFMYRNNSGGTVTFTFGSAYDTVTASALTVAATTGAYFVFTRNPMTGYQTAGPRWVLTSHRTTGMTAI